MKIINEDITTVTEGIILHGVNCQGRMASGVAKAIKEKWPKVYDKFMESDTGTDMLGSAIPVEINSKLSVVNCYTQEYYGRDGKRYADPKAIETALSFIALFATGGIRAGITTERAVISMPKIGCGLGGLDWDTDVAPIIADIEHAFYVDFDIYEI